jgi:succinylglutamate desuccinylase
MLSISFPSVSISTVYAATCTLEVSCVSALCEHVVQQFKRLHSRILRDLLVASMYEDLQIWVSYGFSEIPESIYEVTCLKFEVSSC